MVKDKKILAHFQTEKQTLIYVILAIVLIPYFIVTIGLLKTHLDITQTISFSLKWCAIILPIVLVYLIAKAVYHSGTVVFKENSLLYYKNIFSKTATEINYSDITECVISDGLWRHSNAYQNGRNIFLYNKSNIIVRFEIYSLLMFMFSLTLHETRVRVVNDKRNLNSISHYYKIDYNSLTNEEKLKLCRHYCKLMKNKQRDGTKILETYKKIFYLFT